MMERRARAERIVAANIEKWGWGPIDEIDGLSEHKLAVDACEAGLSANAAPELLDALREMTDALEAEHPVAYAGELIRARAAIAKAMGDQ